MVLKASQQSRPNSYGKTITNLCHICWFFRALYWHNSQAFSRLNNYMYHHSLMGLKRPWLATAPVPRGCILLIYGLIGYVINVGTQCANLGFCSLIVPPLFPFLIVKICFFFHKLSPNMTC